MRFDSCDRTSGLRLRGFRAVALGLAAAGMTLAIVATAPAQRVRDRLDERWDDVRPVAPTPIEESRRIEDDFAEQAQRSGRGLLREGSLILGARATVGFDDETEFWHARLHMEERARPGGEPREMRLLPNSFLGELLQVIEATPNQHITFELTGETVVYEGRNHLLLRAPARVVGLERIDGEEAASGQARTQPEADDPHPRPRQGRTAAEVMRELERESGPLHRTPLVPRQPPPVQARDAPGDAASPRSPAAPGRDAGEQRQWREGTTVVQRRGRITRDAGGEWRFVFDADAQGLSDPPLTLMPCLLQERIERYARQAGPTVAVLMSGEVFVHDGRAYLLPSAFQLPRERTPLN